MSLSAMAGSRQKLSSVLGRAVSPWRAEGVSGRGLALGGSGGHLVRPRTGPSVVQTYSTATVSSTSPAEDHSQARPFSDIPSPPSVPFFGNLFHLWREGLLSKDKIKKNHILMFSNMFNQYGPIFRWKMLNVEMVCIKDPVAVQELFKKEGKYPARIDIKPWRRYREISGKATGVFLSDGKEWQKTRTIMARPMLRPKHVSTYVRNLDMVSSDMSERLRVLQARADGIEVPDISDELFKWALESICTILFNERMGYLQDNIPQNAQDFIQAMHTIFLTTNALLVPDADVHRFLRTKPWRQSMEAWDTVFRVGEQVMDRQLQEALEREERGEEDEDQPNFLAFISSTGRLSKDEIYSNTIELMGAAIDTTSTTLLWTLYELSRRPELQDRLHQEVTQVIGQDKVMTWDDLKDLHLLKAVIKESLRMYPVAPAISRVLQEDTVIMGYKLPAKTCVAAQVYAMGRDPHLFPDPDQFKPERWLRTGEAHDDINPYSSLPFGFGPRSCIGRRVAEVELQLFLAKMSQQFVVSQVEPEEVSSVAQPILMPETPLHLRFVDRK
ncbi:PREDICTED: cytochrome P450 27C1-like [Branchiostoma belcheri]|uniref:Cytochrome P450 27C1-like n=1 Tax=Branchiostoma belcheri TaxID=7741 RepID=A0A6P5AUW4_BRABE|nr:PREDICTED: cytochrome P450 27C1-like [Branchiostoma belcheri]